jgi:MSHA biogenesis protein MshP
MKNAFQRRRQRGFLVIAAVFLLVVLAGLVAYLTTVSTTSQAASAADFNSARAYQAARAGIEWGAYQILQVPAYATACNGATQTTTLTLGSFKATVTCTASAAITEGASTTVRSYRIVSNGCNTGAASCPGAISSTYVERELALSITN